MSDLFRTLDFTFRIFVLIMAVTLGALFILIGGRAAMAASLKPVSTITENVFTVGDVFSGLTSDKAARVLGAAPQPGQDMVLNARTLMRIAIAMDLPWRPSSTMDQIVIRRDAVQIDTNDIESLLGKALKDKGLEGRFELSFYGTGNPTLILPANHQKTMEIASLNFDRPNDRFEARLVAPSKNRVLAELTLSGKIERLISVPVITSNMTQGDIIDSYDIEWIDVRNSELQDDIILSAEKLVGMAPRRLLVSGKPVRKIDLTYPQLVSRGDTITITYKDGPLNLTAKGKSMQNGAKGDLIRVVNMASSRTIDAMVEGEGKVTVSP